MENRRTEYLYRATRTISLVFNVLPLPLWQILWRMADIFDGGFGAGIRYLLISGRLARCGGKVYFGPFVVVTRPSSLSLGNSVSIHQFTTIISDGGVTIADNVSIAHGCSLVSTEHTYDDKGLPIKYNPVEKRPISIGSDVWLGCKVTVLAGVTIRTRVILGAGAVVTADCDANAVYLGVPARRAKAI